LVVSSRFSSGYTLSPFILLYIEKSGRRTTSMSTTRWGACIGVGIA
jgi:hypothetical protein